MTAIKRVANADARDYVQRCIEFKGSNTFACETHTDHSTLYVVYSYGEHFPMFIAETGDDGVTRWYNNQDRSSVSTSKHQTQLHPHVGNMVPMDTARMRVLAHGGLTSLTQGKATPPPCCSDKLLQIIAATYQILGVYDAPKNILDVLANPVGATQKEVDAMLPFEQPADERTALAQEPWTPEDTAHRPGGLAQPAAVQNEAVGILRYDYKGRHVRHCIDMLNDDVPDGAPLYTHPPTATVHPEKELLEYWNAVEGWVKVDEVRKHFDSVGCGTIYKTAGEDRVPLYTSPLQRQPLTVQEVEQILHQHNYELHGDRARYIVRMTEEAHGITPPQGKNDQ